MKENKKKITFEVETNYLDVKSANANKQVPVSELKVAKKEVKKQ